MNQTQTRVRPGTVVVLLVLAALAVGVFGPMGQPLRQSLQGRVIRAEVEIDHGEFEVAVLSESSLHGRRIHADGETFSRTFGVDILMERGETLFVAVSGAAIADGTPKRTLTCRLRENGKEVDKHTVVVRAWEAGAPCGCSLTFHN